MGHNGPQLGAELFLDVIVIPVILPQLIASNR